MLSLRHDLLREKSNCARHVCVRAGNARVVPRISSFYGIVISMYFLDHGPPHFHAERAEHSAKVAIATGEVYEGGLPRRDSRLVREWAKLHRPELEENWIRARADQALATIDPLP
jgi:hypothetical protein